MPEKEIIEVWGASNLFRWPEKLLELTLLPKPTRDFLERTGLPMSTGGSLRFALSHDEMSASARRPQGLIVGYDGACPIEVDYEHTTRVCATKEDGRRQFVNSGLRELALCLTAFEQYRVKVRELVPGIDDVRQQRLVDDTERVIRDIDGPSMDASDNWWSEVIEQMRYGFL